MHLKQSKAILKLILNLIGSQWRRIKDDVTCSCLGNEHINRTDAFCTRWSLLRSVAATIMIGYWNSLFWTIDFSSIFKAKKSFNTPKLCRWYKHRITMREIDFANHRKVIYPMPFFTFWTTGTGSRFTFRKLSSRSIFKGSLKVILWTKCTISLQIYRNAPTDSNYWQPMFCTCTKVFQKGSYITNNCYC